jgi:tetratricopeptide (TPR) repeat protein
VNVVGLFDAKSFARELIEEDRLPEAIEAAAAQMAEDPTSPEPYLDRGEALDLSGRHEEAVADFERAFALDRAAGILGDDDLDDRLFEALRQWAEATADADRAAEILRRYETTFPQGRHVADIERRLARLGGEKAPTWVKESA